MFGCVVMDVWCGSCFCMEVGMMFWVCVCFVYVVVLLVGLLLVGCGEVLLMVLRMGVFFVLMVFVDFVVVLVVCFRFGKGLV